MSSLLDDLLDVSRITRGAFTLKKSYVNLQDVIDAAVEASKPVIDRREHTLRTDTGSQDITLEADPVRMTQVLTNLLTNAAKYTPKGGLIHLGVRFEAKSVAIHVRDNGVGISAEMLGKTFDMFAQVEAQKARAEGGLGIGLALVKGLVELHGGRIEARSDGLGRGSEFVVILPRSIVVEREDSMNASAGAAVAPASKRVLIVDDHSDGADMLGVLLSQAGHEIHLAHSGPEALELAKKIRPQVAVLDIGLPGMTGYEVAERLRREAWGQDINLIAVTGWGNDEDRRRAIAAGFDMHMTKPVDPEALRKLIENGRAS
jgi:CheY-like chemotaxis protein/two-component sensor histidine kinase